jgi:hypothetical protein
MRCEWCGADVPPGPSTKRFCTERCRSNAENARRHARRRSTRPILVRACLNCARQVDAPRGPGRTPLFCGQVCRRDWWGAHPEASRRRRYERECPHCGRTFTTTHRRQRCCSRSCGSRGAARLSPRLCVTCGARFQPDGRDQRNCGRECAVLAAAIANTGQRRGVMAIAQDCQFCGATFHRARFGMYCSPVCTTRGRAALRRRRFVA